MCGILGPTAGESWLAYVGVPTDYPDLGELAREIDDGMWEAGQEILAERKAEDPTLRAMADERCTLWIYVNVPAGTLPTGAHVERKYWYGRIRPRRSYDSDFDPPDRIYVDWQGRLPAAPDPDRWEAGPRIHAADLVDARVPMPFDAAPLLRWIEEETGVPTVRRPRVRRKTRTMRVCALCGRLGTHGFRVAVDGTGTTYCMGRVACDRRRAARKSV